MNMKKFVKLIVIFVLVFTWAHIIEAGETNFPEQKSGPNLKGSPNLFSLLNSSRIKWSHSYSVSFFSGGGQSGSLGMLRTSMLYEISPKISLQLNLGIQHQGGMLSSDSRNKPDILPGFRFDYHPSESFHIMLNVQKVSGLYYPSYQTGGFWPDLLYQDR
jgi:hypothetical protein